MSMFNLIFISRFFFLIQFFDQIRHLKTFNRFICLQLLENFKVQVGSKIKIHRLQKPNLIINKHLFKSYKELKWKRNMWSYMIKKRRIGLSASSVTSPRTFTFTETGGETAHFSKNSAYSLMEIMVRIRRVATWKLGFGEGELAFDFREMVREEDFCSSLYELWRRMKGRSRAFGVLRLKD